MSTRISPRRSVLGALAAFDEATFGDERERRVWMEAYVIAYEVALLAAFTLAAVMVWVGDRSVGMWSIAVIWIVGLGNIAALTHLRQHGLTDIPWRARWSFWSFRIRMLLGAIWLVGFVVTVLGDGGTLAERGGWSYLAGMVVGAAVAIGAFVIADRRTKRRAQTQLPEDDTFDEA